MSQYLEETLYEGYGQKFQVEKILFEKKTELFHIIIFESKSHGKVLMLDGIVQLTERDEYIYHEMLTHVPMLAHGNVSNVLIIGGGDGGMARRVLMHPGVSVTQVEIDQNVIDMSIKYLDSVGKGVFHNPGLTLVIEDGARFVEDTTETFDIIITDLTDPIGPAEKLFQQPFYEACKKRLKQGGILVTQNGVPFMQADELQGCMTALCAVFKDVTCYLATVPTYIGGPMAFGWATDDPDLRDVSRNTLDTRYKKSGITTDYYNPEVHKAAFALPNYVLRLIPSD